MTCHGCPEDRPWAWRADAGAAVREEEGLDVLEVVKEREEDVRFCDGQGRA